jgi:hypothetical protein
VLNVTDVGSLEGLAGDIVPNPVTVTMPTDGIASGERCLVVAIAIGTPMTTITRTTMAMERTRRRASDRFCWESTEANDTTSWEFLGGRHLK